MFLTLNSVKAHYHKHGYIKLPSFSIEHTFQPLTDGSFEGSQTVFIHFPWEFQIVGVRKIIWKNWLTLCNVRSDHELTKSDAVDGMSWAEVSKKIDCGNVHGVEHTI